MRRISPAPWPPEETTAMPAQWMIALYTANGQ
jgi:hypothetical protein